MAARLGRRRILIIEDHPFVRRGIAMLINAERDMRVCCEVDTASEAVKAIRSQKPDVVLLDMLLPDENGLVLSKRLRRLFPQLGLLMMSIEDESIFAERALKAGANGYIMKDQTPQRLIEALRRVGEGESYLSRRASSQVLRHLMQLGIRERSGKDLALSDRELEVLEHLGKGLKPSEVAKTLSISVKTIGSYQMRIKTKLGLQSFPDLVRYAVHWVHTKSPTSSSKSHAKN